MDVQTLEAVLQFVNEQQKSAQHVDCSCDFRTGMGHAYTVIAQALRDTIQHEADIGAEEMVRQEEEMAKRKFTWE